MTHYSQQTDSVVVAPPQFDLTALPRDETLGALFTNYLPLPVGSSLLNRAWDLTHRLENKDQSQQAKDLLTSIQQSLSVMERYNYDLSSIPPLRAAIEDDGSILFEWIFRDYRLGFGIELNAKESGWFLATNQKLGDIAASGLLSGVGLNSLTSWLLLFILTHA